MKKVFKNIKYDRYYKEILPYLKKEKNQQYFAVILTLSASIFFALFAINPTLSTVTHLRREVLDSRSVNKKLSDKINNLSSLSQEYQVIQKDIPYILDAIPNQPESLVLTAQIQSIAQSSEIKLSNIEISPMSLDVPESTSSSSLIFALSADGSYESIKKFVSNLIDMQRIVSIDTISISKPEITIDEVRLSIKGSAHFKK